MQVLAGLRVVAVLGTVVAEAVAQGVGLGPTWHHGLAFNQQRNEIVLPGAFPGSPTTECAARRSVTAA